MSGFDTMYERPKEVLGERSSVWLLAATVLCFTEGLWSVHVKQVGVPLG